MRQTSSSAVFYEHRNKVNGVIKNRSVWDLIDHKEEPVCVCVCVCVYSTAHLENHLLLNVNI